MKTNATLKAGDAVTAPGTDKIGKVLSIGEMVLVEYLHEREFGQAAVATHALHCLENVLAVKAKPGHAEA